MEKGADVRTATRLNTYQKIISTKNDRFLSRQETLGAGKIFKFMEKE